MITIDRLQRGRLLVGAVITALALVAGGCSAQDPDATSPGAEPSAAGSGTEIQAQQVNEELRSRLPADIQEANQLVSVNSGSFPPYEIIQTDGGASGASADLLTAMGQLWGIEIEHETVDGLSSILTGMSADRFQLAFGPIGDFKERQAQNDFIDYVQEFVVFAVPSGNPKGIDGLGTTCGLRIAVQAGGSAEKVIKGQSETCVEDGKEEISVMSFKDQPQSILSVQSGRADAFFSSRAPLTYFVEQSGGKLELAGTEEKNGFDTLYQGAVVKKDSELGPLVRDTLQVLFDNGTYAAIMKKWGLETNMIDKPDLNLAVS